MAKKTIKDEKATLEELFRKRAQHEQAIAAQEKKVKEMERSRRNRQNHILAGELRRLVEKHDADAKKMMDRLVQGLTRPQDRREFDLPPLPGKAGEGKPTPSPGQQPRIKEA